MSSDGAELQTENLQEDATQREIIQFVQRQAQRISELEAKVDELRTRTAENNHEKVSRREINILLDSLLGGHISNYATEPTEHLPLLEDFNDRFSDIEGTVTRHESIIEKQGAATGNRKDVAWHDVVQYARNVRDEPDHSLPEHRVAIYTDDIVAATGYSKRRAQQLIEEWGEEKRGTEWRPYKKLETGDYQRKRLKIDLNVWNDQGPIVDAMTEMESFFRRWQGDPERFSEIVRTLDDENELRERLKNRLSSQPDWTADILREYSPRAFEQLVAKLYESKGYDTSLTPRSHDFGVDVWAKDSEETLAIQAKRHDAENTIGRPIIQRLESTIVRNEADQIAIVTSSSFSKAATEYAEEAKYVELIDGTDFAQLLREHGIPIEVVNGGVDSSD